MQDPQIFLSSSGALVRFSGDTVLFFREEVKTGGAVPPGGPLTRRRSVMLSAFWLQVKVSLSPTRAWNSALLYFI